MNNFIKVKCKNCNKDFYRLTGRFNEAVKFKWNQYCSKKCEISYKTIRKKMFCINCGKIFERTPCAISPNNYCSRSCAVTINNKKHHKKESIVKICVKCGTKYKKSTNNLKYCSRKCSIESRKRSPEELINIIKVTAKKLNRVPARREVGKINDSCRKIFGSWNKAVLAAGFIPNRSHNNRMYKCAHAKATDGHLCDSISELLIDNWLYKNKISHERNAHYPKTNHRADWKIFKNDKTIFIEYFGLANDSPRYDRSIKEKERLCKKYNIPLISIFPKDLYPKNYLEINLKNKLGDYFQI